MGAPAFAPDSALAGAVRPSPSHDARRGRGQPDSLILHYTGMVDGPSAIARLCASDSEVSCHYVVEESGAVLQLVPEARRAWCAGRSFWAGETDMNSASVNVEIVNGGHDFGLPPYPDPQIDAVVALCRDVMTRHGIPAHRLLAHSDVAPARKQDPGEHFPWHRLAAAGVGLWVPPSDDPSRDAATDMGTLTCFQADLARFGYGIDAGAPDDAASRIVVAAFQRRFRPARVDGVADPGTRDTLARLLARRFSADPEPAPARA